MILTICKHFQGDDFDLNSVIGSAIGLLAGLLVCQIYLYSIT